MWGFTRQEQRAILLLLLTFVTGSLVWWYRQRQSPPVVAPVEVATFEEYAYLLRRDSVAAPRETGDRSEKKPSSTLLDLNAATYEELLQLPGVGPVLAKRIVEHRRTNGPFRHLEELKNVKGIGAKTYVKLARLLIIK
jgi:competence protein ComEA